ncbi:MAG TPA: translocation/assembly module TamB domain-containing protein [Vicinamibacterales bacterium]|nr:translocation/assembly module TamB domain-containing protein [Vicinamibacterales bacterium]
MVRILAILGIAVVVLVVALVVFLHTTPARRYVVTQVTELLRQQNIEFSTDELGYNLLELRMSLRNLRIRAQDAPDLPPFATIDRVTLDLSLTQLLRRRYVLESGEAEGVAIHYFVGADERDNLPRPPSDPEQPSEPPDYLIEQLQVRTANVRYENVPQRIDVTIPVSLIDVEGNALTDRHTVGLEAAGGTVVVQDRKATLDQLSGELDLGEDDARIESVDLVAEGARLTLTGTVEQFADPLADLALRGTVDAARASAIAALPDPVGGAIEIDATAKGPLATPMVNGRITGSNVSFRNLSDITLATTASFDTDTRHATFSDLELRAPFGEVMGHGEVSLAGTDASRVTASVSSLDAAALMRAFHTPYIVASRVDAQVQAEWPGIDYLQASGNATATLTPTASRASRSVIPVGGRLDLTGRANAVDVVLSRVNAAGAALNGRVRVVNQRDLTGTANLRVVDVARTVAVAEEVLGEPGGALLPVRVAGGVDGTARISGTVSAPTVAADVRAPALAVGDARGLALDAGVRYTPALVSVDRLNVTWQKAIAQASGTVELTGARALDLTVNANALEVAELLRAVDQATVPASGTLSLQGRIAGTTAQPAVTATLTGTDLVAYNEHWGSLGAHVSMSGREVVVAELLLDKPQPDGNGRLSGGATYHLDRQTYTVDLESDNLELLTLALPDGRQVRGRLELAAKGTGSVDQPAGTVNLTADALRIDEYNIGRVAAGAVLANRQATIDAGVPTYGVTADVVIGVDRPYPTTAKLRVDDLQLAALPIQLDTPLEGTLRARADATGNLETPEDVQATAIIEAFSGSWNAQPFSVGAPAELRYANERLALEQLRLVARDSTIAVQGELPLTERGAPGVINLDARANLATLAQYAPAGTNLTAAGELTVTGLIRGTLRAIDPELTIIVANGSIVTPEIAPGLSNLNVRAQVRGGVATLEQLDANFGATSLTATGRAPFDVLPELPVGVPRPGGPANLTAGVQRLDLAEVPGAPQGLSGRVSLNAQMSATRADLAALEGRITFPELEVVFEGLTLGQEQVSTIALGGGTARIEQFTLTGSVGTVSATGSVGLTDARPISLDVNGNLNVAAISMFTDVVTAEGDTTLQIAARGTVAEPELDGFVDLADATFLVDEPTVAAENVNARLDLSGRRITLSELTGSVNGGTLAGAGHVEFGTGGIADAALELVTDDVAFDAPLDLRSLSDATVTLTRAGDEYVVGGQITLSEAGLTGDINFDAGLLAAMNARRSLDLTEQRNPFLEQVRFNLDIDTATPILVDNNLARAEITADLRLIGTPYEPGLAGRLTVLEEGEIVLNERRYAVERGVITFIGERRIQPSFDLLLNTSARSYDITLAVTGIPGETETSLTSDPALPEPDIMALLVTGRTLEEMRGEEFEAAREQVLSYLAGRVGSQLGRTLQRATGFDTVRIEPNLIANEADPSARLTVGEDIADDIELIYSVNLTDSSDQIYVVEYDVTRRFQTRGVRQPDGSYRFDIRHDLRFGGRPEPRRQPRQRPVISDIAITSDGTIPETELRRLLDMEEGDDYDFFAAREAVEDIQELLEERGNLQSRVRLHRDGDDRSVTLNLEVTAGPRVQLIFEGVTPPGDVIDEVRTQWRRGIFDTQRLDDATEELEGWLMRDRYLQPTVQGTIEEISPEERRVRFGIQPGTRYARVILAFEGAQGIAADELDEIVEQQDLEEQLFTDPVQVTELLERYYREQGYLNASIDEPRYEFQGTEARVVLEVTEGPRFLVRDITAAGAAVILPDTLIADLPFQSGDPFLPFAAENALQQVRDAYWRRGYNDVRTDYQLVLDRDAGRVDVQFEVVEGRQTVVADITVAGNEQTSDRLIREQLEVEVGAPLDVGALARSRRNLYDTGAFSIADIAREEVESATDNGGAVGQKPVRLAVSVREVQPIQLRYGASYDTERGIGGIFDVSNHNTLGKARVVGVRSRYDAQLREVRGYISQPSLRYWPIQTIGNLYFSEQHYPSTDLSQRFNIDRKGASIQQEREFGDTLMWNYGFRYEVARTFDPRPGAAVDERLTVTPLTSTLTRETRDDVLDATEGSFSSQALSYSPSWLGSDQAFVKYFGQYFRYFPLQPERRERFTGEILRPRFVYAVGVRAGLARGFGGPLPRSERFFAGGSTTLRGFEQNALGTIGAEGVPEGGQAMFVINNELRFPLVSIFDGVVFSDVGNVFPRLSDWSFSDLRETAGVGLRVRTPWFLLRGDYGFLLDRRAGERRGRFYFSLGQAF